MKLLIYVGHPAQYHFFKHIIQRLKLEGHQVLLLIKTKDVLESLVQHDGHAYRNIQPKSRKTNQVAILLASFVRTCRVIRLAQRFKADLLIGTDASIAQAGFFLRKHAITTLEDDYNVISKLAHLTYPFTSTILVPSVCDVGKWSHKKVGYNGYMKLAYLHPDIFTASENIKNTYIATDRYCLLRLSQLAAHHDIGMKGLNISIINQLIQVIEYNGYQVFISSETEVDDRLKSYCLNIHHHDIHHVLAFASLLVSDSQSMSVEAAMLGVPSIRYSDFSGQISVLEELEQTYELTFGVKTQEISRLLKLTNSILSDADSHSKFQDRRSHMLKDKVNVTDFMVDFITHYPAGISDENVHQSLINSTSQKLKRDFTVAMYRQLMIEFQEAGYQIVTFLDWCEGKAASFNKYIILRHDIDKLPKNALNIARVESALGVKASYYWLGKKQVFDPLVIKQVAELGHEIGYHYEDLTQCKGNPEKTIVHFEQQLKKFRQLYPVKTICMHGSPLTRFDNKDIWKHYDYRTFGIVGEPYLDIFGSHDDSFLQKEIYYLTDTGRLWNGDRFSVRDKVKKNRVKDYRTSRELIWAVKSGKLPDKMMITTHPQRWTDQWVFWTYEWMLQSLKNVIKRYVIKRRFFHS